MPRSSRRRGGAIPAILTALGLAALGLAVLAGCTAPPRLATATPPAPPHRPAPPAPAYRIETPFDEAAFAPYAGSGSSVVAGEAFWRSPDGGIILAAGREVVLVPDTAYTRELLEPARSRRFARVANFDPRYFRYRRSVTADARGQFRFTGLPAGAYILQTSVRVDDSARYGLADPEIFLHREVTVAPDAAANVIVSQ